jgi:hypothetical protein
LITAGEHQVFCETNRPELPKQLDATLSGGIGTILSTKLTDIRCIENMPIIHDKQTNESRKIYAVNLAECKHDGAKV